MHDPSPRRRRWPRVPVRASLRGMMVFVLIVGGVFGWIIYRARVQRDAVVAIKQIGGRVEYDWQQRDGRYISKGTPWWPGWFNSLFGVDYLSNVTLVIFPGEGSDTEMVHLGNLSRVDTLIFDDKNVSDRGI